MCGVKGYRNWAQDSCNPKTSLKIQIYFQGYTEGEGGFLSCYALTPFRPLPKHHQQVLINHVRWNLTLVCSHGFAHHWYFISTETDLVGYFYELSKIKITKNLNPMCNWQVNFKPEARFFLKLFDIV